MNGLARRARPGLGGLVLLYHRIASGPDPFLLNVSQQHFGEHLAVLKTLTTPLPLDAVVDARRRVSSRGRPPVAITFDDGYADNLFRAKPVLERHDVPATVFVMTGWFDGGSPWWDELACLLLGDEGDKGHWHIESEADADEVHARFRSLSAKLKVSANSEREDLLRPLRVEPIPAAHRSGYALLSRTQVATLADGSLLEVGAHTVSHPALASLSPEHQEREINSSRSELESIVGRPIRSFAYPYGTVSDYSAATVAIVRRAGFRLACANFASCVGPLTSRFAVPRFVVRDWDGDEFERHLLRFAGGLMP